MTTFNNIKNSLKPLDLVMFSGGEYVSHLIKFMEKNLLERPNEPNNGVDPGAFSHVGMVVTSDILEHKQVLPGKFYVLESTMGGPLSQDKVLNIMGKSKFGVQLRDLEELIPSYLSSEGSAIAIARLKPEYSTLCRDKTLFTSVFKKYNGRTYDINPISLAASLLKVCRCIREPMEEMTGTNNWLFCSELVAQVYIDMGVINNSINPKNVVPMDFVGFETDKNGIPNMIDYPITYIIGNF